MCVVQYGFYFSTEVATFDNLQSLSVGLRITSTGTHSTRCYQFYSLLHVPALIASH